MDTPTDSRTRILNAAAELFYLQGFESVGLQKICSQATVSKSSFYHFFTSKDELAVAVVEAHWLSGKQKFEALLNSSLSPLQKIQAIFNNMFSMAEMTCQNQGEIFGCPFGNLASELSNSNPALRKKIQLVFGDLTDIYTDLIKQAKEQGELSLELDACETANALVMLMQGMSVMGKVYNDPNRMRRNGEYALGLILGTN
ncbi:MAG: TetR/AcrR family transcriptional regulator [Gallionella sp.]